MIRKIIGFILRGRHYWRRVPFDEVAELYVSRLMTVLAINLVSLFMAIYLYRLGYSVVFIAIFYGLMYVLKTPLMLPFAKYVAYYGPKHGVLLANLLRIPSLASMTFVPEYGLPALAVFGAFQAASAGIYNISYGVNFSKVRTIEKTGKELGMMRLIEQGAKVLAPIGGGLIATFWGPSVAVVIASVLFAAAAIPLFRTVEPVKLRAKIVFEAFPWRLTWRTFVGAGVIGYDFVVGGITWSLFVATVVFASLGDGIYASLGAISSVGVLVSMLAAWFFGKIVDKKQGDTLFTAGVMGVSVIHLFRPFTGGASSVLGANMATETANSAYVLPWTRATFDIADTSGHRVAYFMMIGIMENIGAGLACFALAGLVWLFGVGVGLQMAFVAGAAIALNLLIVRRHTRQ